MERNCAADVNVKEDGRENKQDINSSNLKDSIYSFVSILRVEEIEFQDLTLFTMNDFFSLNDFRKVFSNFDFIEVFPPPSSLSVIALCDVYKVLFQEILKQANTFCVIELQRKGVVSSCTFVLFVS